MENNTIHLNYKIIGSGTPVLMLHGYCVDHRLLFGCMEPAFEKHTHYKRIYLDLPGMGKTKAESWLKNVNQMIELLINFIDEHIAHERFLLIGQSFGGYLAQGIAHKMSHRIKGLALINPAISMSKREVPKKRVLLQDEFFLASLAQSERDEFTSMMVIQNATTWERYHDEILCGLKIADQNFLSRFKCNLSYDSNKVRENFISPTLIITGRQDHITGYRDVWKILENYPRATFAVLDRAGHNLPIEQKTLFESLIKEWLDRIEDGCV